MSALDRTALAVADLAYMDEPGSAANKVAAAITAYLWAVEQLVGGAFLGPSYDDWQTYRASLPEVLR